ncbi:type IV secretion system protein [Paraburkholderia azotifigens]|uniref:type IV secretion system protein n=1 Tax=Paraburkholderia azotifigens TaxID=2057004 RepID=UPI001F023AA4|nr:type IV secretion system protein [Paraburkholderia azotifigens]
MAYDGVTQIFNYMDAVTTQIVAENVSRIIGWAAPIAALGLTIQLTIDGLATLLRPSGEPLSQLVEKFVKYFAIVAIAGAGGLYVTTLASTAMHLPDELGSVLLLNGSTASGSTSAIAGMIDSAMDHSLTVMRTLFDQAGITSERGLVALILGIVVIISTLLICGIGAISILLAKFLLAITVCFGPFFILLLIVPPLVSFFGNWLGSVLNYIFLIAMTAMSFGIFMHFFDNAISAAANPNPNSGALMAIITAGIITVMAVVLLKSLPDLAARWTNGVSTKLASTFPSRVPLRPAMAEARVAAATAVRAAVAVPEAAAGPVRQVPPADRPAVPAAPVTGIHMHEAPRDQSVASAGRAPAVVRPQVPAAAARRQFTYQLRQCQQRLRRGS